MGKKGKFVTIMRRSQNIDLSHLLDLKRLRLDTAVDIMNSSLFLLFVVCLGDPVHLGVGGLILSGAWLLFYLHSLDSFWGYARKTRLRILALEEKLVEGKTHETENVSVVDAAGKGAASDCALESRRQRLLTICVQFTGYGNSVILLKASFDLYLKTEGLSIIGSILLVSLLALYYYSLYYHLFHMTPMVRKVRSLDEQLAGRYV